MKKLILSLIAIFIFSFSFAQREKNVSKKELMSNSKKAVEYLKKELKLKGSKLTSVEKAFTKYATNMSSLNEKIAKKDESAKGNSEALVANKKAKFKMMNDFLKKRDGDATKGFSKKEIEKYRKTSRAIHPFTLRIKEMKK
tara:strand:- start:1291 stop:1713 length:423 start_codon:yes stop_codon:yes gene_type:complete